MRADGPTYRLRSLTTVTGWPPACRHGPLPARRRRVGVEHPAHARGRGRRLPRVGRSGHGARRDRGRPRFGRDRGRRRHRRARARPVARAIEAGWAVHQRWAEIRVRVPVRATTPITVDLDGSYRGALAVFWARAVVRVSGSLSSWSWLRHDSRRVTVSQGRPSLRLADSRGSAGVPGGAHVSGQCERSGATRFGDTPTCFGSSTAVSARRPPDDCGVGIRRGGVSTRDKSGASGVSGSKVRADLGTVAAPGGWFGSTICGRS